METLSFDETLLFDGIDYEVNKFITIHHPTLIEILKYGEEKYMRLVHSLCATSSDYKSFLFDNGMDFTEVSEFQMFQLLSSGMKQADTQILFGDLDFSKFKLVQNVDTGDVALYCNENEVKIFIDEITYVEIVTYLRHVHNLKKTLDKPINETTKKIQIQIERDEIKKHANEKYKSYIISAILALVNCQYFKYDYSTVLDLSLYHFYQSIISVQKQLNYYFTMIGIYTGNIDAKKIDMTEISWMNNTQ